MQNGKTSKIHSTQEDEMAKHIYVDQHDHYDLLVVQEDMLTAEGVAEEVLRHIASTEEPLRIVVCVSQNSKRDISTFMKTLDRIDETAVKNFVPVMLSVCFCCMEELSELLANKRWRSRWEPQRR